MAANVAGHVTQSIPGSSNSLLSGSTSQVHEQQPQASSALCGKTSFSKGKDSRGRFRPSFAKSLPPLEINKGSQAYVHVQYVFKPAFTNTLEPIPFSVSTPLAVVADSLGPSRELNFENHDEIVKDLGRLFNIPSPGSDVEVVVDIKRHPYADLQIGDRWKEIHGSKDWEGLVEENLDPVFRGELIRYGEFAQATYDAFNNDKDSKFCGNAKFDKTELLKEVGLLDRGYEISEFLYATADAHVPKFFKRASKEGTWSKDSNFMGFVAVCNSPRELARLGRRDIVVAWRGTVTKLEWLENIRDYFSPTGLDPRGQSDVMVESGFLSVYKSKNEHSRYNKMSAREQVLAAVLNLVQKYKDENLSITVTGHSLGSALSMLCAYDIAESGINKRAHSPKVPQHWDEPHLDAGLQHPDHHKEPLESRVPVSVISFAGPRLGNSAFKARVEELGVKVMRVVNVHDIVPKVPGIIFNEKLEFLHRMLDWMPSSYVHIGKELALDTKASPYLKNTTDPGNAHILEAYLHMLSGYHGLDAPFSPVVRRDIALVNKFSGFLEPQFGVPANWWEEKKMVMDEQTGHWLVVGDNHEAPEPVPSPAYDKLVEQLSGLVPMD